MRTSFPKHVWYSTSLLLSALMLIQVSCKPCKVISAECAEETPLPPTALPPEFEYFHDYVDTFNVLAASKLDTLGELETFYPYYENIYERDRFLFHIDSLSPVVTLPDGTTYTSLDARGIITKSCPCNDTMVLVDYNLLAAEELDRSRHTTDKDTANGGGNKYLYRPPIVLGNQALAEFNINPEFISPRDTVIDTLIFAILDSGIDPLYRTELGSRIIDEHNFIDSSAPADDDSDKHGTNVAKIIDQITGGRSKFMIYKIMPDNTGMCTTYDAMCALFCAVSDIRNNGIKADIINMSFGGYGEDKVFKEALAYASESAILVASKGNNGRNTADLIHLPSDAPQVFDIAGTNESITKNIPRGTGGSADELTHFVLPSEFSATSSAWQILWDCSNYSNTNLYFAAPAKFEGTGGNIITGTSFSSPYAAACIANMIYDEGLDQSTTTKVEYRNRLNIICNLRNSIQTQFNPVE